MYGGSVTIMVCVMMILQYLFSINVGLAVFNLLPIPPLDGFNILRYFTGEKVDRWFYVHQRELSIGFLVIILLISKLPYDYNILYRATDAVSNLLWKAVSWIPEKRWS
jgi:Zn-dependent protease